MPVKRILCLANSKKLSGRCIAGREVGNTGPGPWVRPVSARLSEEVSEDERRYENGTDPAVLDVIDVPLLQHVPHACQTENWRLDPEWYWVRAGRMDWQGLQAYVERTESLWINGHSTYNGSNDEIPQQEADALLRSLYLIHVPQVQIWVGAPSIAFGNTKRRVQAQFSASNTLYEMWVTDPKIEQRYLARDNGHYALGECCLTISLGEPFTKTNGQPYRYKLVAAIIERALVG